MLHIRSSDLTHLTAESWYLFASLSPFPPLPRNWQPTFHSISMSLTFFFILHRSDIIEYLSFSVWLISLSIMASVLSKNARVFFFIMVECIPMYINTPHFPYPFICQCSLRWLPCLGCRWIILQGTWGCRYHFKIVVSFALDICL